MSNFDTVKAITDNLKSVLIGLGINFTHETYDDIDLIPASILPHGQIFYEGEDFEYAHGQKPEYAEVKYKVRVVLMGRDSRDLIRNQQKWVHLIRDGLTVNIMNIGDLVTSKLINQVSVTDVSVENTAVKTALNININVRYREV